LQAKWNLSASVGNTKQFVWYILNPIADTLESIWDIKQKIGQSWQTIWKILIQTGRRRFGIRYEQETTILTTKPSETIIPSETSIAVTGGRYGSGSNGETGEGSSRPGD
jgi:hypothetical protein